ncbi:MAG: hypothetical protein O2955_13585 [Planctomycetota bacterium]|nr:hypothetical protein [Planctomycetota bacterium]MDA1213541.1 hypothetical protein [Planctomycetota bacterium]
MSHPDHRHRLSSGRFFYLAGTSCALLVMINAVTLAENQLDEVRRKVRKDSPDAPAAAPAKPSSECKRCGQRTCCCDDDDGGGFFTALFGEAILFTVASPGWVPHRLLADDLQNTTSFLEYPYADDLPGSLVINEFDVPETRSWMGQFTAEAGSDFRDLDRFGGRLQLDTASRFGIDTEFNLLSENLGGGNDSLWLGDINLTYRFAQSETWQFRAGVGANWLADKDETNGGFNFTYNVDVYPVRPWVIKTGIDYGTLGHTNRFHYRGTVGFQFHEVELFTGYDYQHIASQDFHMMISGLTVWFR